MSAGHGHIWQETMSETVDHPVAERPVAPSKGRQNALLAKTAKGTGWVMIWRLFTRGIGLVSTLILVRLLMPSDIGLVALGTGFAQAIDGLSILGVDDVLIREKSPGRTLYDTAFTLNLIRNFGTALIIALTAMPIAGFFGEPRLAHVLYALAIATMVEAFENVGIIDFRRDMAFEKEFQLRLLPRLAGTTATIALAFLWRSYWALVVGILTLRISRVAMSYVMHPYRARLSIGAWRHIIGFSTWTWIISLVVLVRDRTGSFVVGRVLGSAAVGIFSVAGEIATLPGTELVQPLCRAAWSAFAVARHTDENIAEIYLRVIGAISLLVIPASIGIVLVAEPLVYLALGVRWMSAVPLLQIMAAGGMFAAFGAIAGTVLSSHAVLRSMFRIITVSYLIGAPVFILMTLKYGLVGGAFGGMLGGILEISLMTRELFRRYHVGLRAFVMHLWRPVFASAVMTLVLLMSGFAHPGMSAPAAAQTEALVVLVILGVITYGAALLAAWLITGRPQGAETDLLALMRPALAKLGIGRGTASKA